MENRELSASLEDYLEAVYLISSKDDVAHANKIAEYLKVGKSSVSWALNQLSDKGLINYKPYEAITLTEAGEKLAKRVAIRHDNIKNFLREVLSVEEDIAEANACRMEHVVDKEILQRMTRFVEFLDKCPRAGRQWMKGFGLFCDQGKKHDNCLECLDLCREQIEKECAKIIPVEAINEELPKVQKSRDRHVLDRLAEIIMECGGRLNWQEMTAAEVFLGTERHQTIQEIHENAKKRNTGVTLANVERAMELLCEHKMARILRLNNQVIYEHFHPESHHDHLYCVKCGAIVEFFDPRIEALQMDTVRRADFRLLQHHLNIYGVCRDCIQRETQIRSLNECLAGEIVSVVRMVSDKKTQIRIAELGLNKGDIVEILSDKCCGDNIILARGGARIMLDRQTAKQIKVMNVHVEHKGHVHGVNRFRHRHALEKRKGKRCD
jgi:DtxR family Mn-dependent transcriptional regulator